MAAVLVGGSLIEVSGSDALRASASLLTPLPVGLLVVLALLGQLGCVIALWRAGDGRLSLPFLFAAHWTILFGLRGLSIPDALATEVIHPKILAGGETLVRSGVFLSTAALVCFTVFASLTMRSSRAKPWRLPELGFTTYALLGMIGIVGILISGRLPDMPPWVLQGMIGLAYFSIAALAMQQHRIGQRPVASVVVALAAVFAGLLTGTKMATIYPVAAWIFGWLTARRETTTRRVARRRRVWPVLVLLGIVVSFGYVYVQGQRTARLWNNDTDALGATVSQLTAYDVGTGARRDVELYEIPLNVVGGVLYRMKGLDSLLILLRDVPARVPHTDGRTIAEPVLSAITSPVGYEYGQASLGRSFNLQFWSLRPETDPSSQAITLPGDLYLDFGLAGIVIGVALVGGLVGLLDGRLRIGNPTAIGLTVAAGFPLADVGQGVVFIGFTSISRGALVLFAAAVLGRRRAS